MLIVEEVVFVCTERSKINADIVELVFVSMERKNTFVLSVEGLVYVSTEKTSINAEIVIQVKNED